MSYTTYLPYVSTQSKGLKDYFRQHGIDFGFAVHTLGGVQGQIIRKNASICTPEISMKFENLRPERNRWTPLRTETIVNNTRSLGAKFHGHVVCWHDQNPAWFNSLPNHEVPQILGENIRYIAQKWGSRMHSLDVVNETYFDFTPRGKWYEAMGLDYVYQAFDLVKQYMPNVKRVYNSVFYNYKDKQFALELVRQGRAQAIGHQFHIGFEVEPDRAFINNIKAYGAEFYMSELGILCATDQEQAIAFANLARYALESKTKRFIVWGVKDPSFRGPTTLHKAGSGAEKLSYDSVRDVVR